MPPPPGSETELHLGLAKLGGSKSTAILSSVQAMAVSAAAAERKAVDGSDHRFAKILR